MLEYPVTDGITTFIMPPEGYNVDFQHPKQQKAIEHYLIFGIMGSVALTALAQRLYTKIYLSTGFKMDDAFMCLAWIFSIGLQATQTWSIAIGGLCHHAWEMPINVYEKHMLSSYISAPCFILCNGFTKMSLLTFYLNISPHKWFQWSIWATFALVTCYTIIIGSMLLFGCSPIHATWDPYTTGTCLNANILYMAIAISNIVSDVLLFLIPIRTVVRLKMGSLQKIGAIILFGIASITVTTSVIRLSYLPSLLSTADIPWVAAPANIWAFLEVNLFIICGSMPTLRKFFKHFAPKLMSSSGGSSKAMHSATIGSQRRMKHPSRSQYEQFDEMEFNILHETQEDKSESRSTATGRTATAR